jgi:hypothetical protein
MKTITSNEGSIVLTEQGHPLQTIPRGKQYVTQAGQAVVVEGDGKRWTLGLSETTVDGESFDTVEALAEKISSFKRGEGSATGLQKASTQDMQDGTNDEEYVTPLKVHQFVEWFSSMLLKTNEEVTEPLTVTQLNELYPDAPLRTIVDTPNAGTGMRYTKLSPTRWEVQPYTQAEQ